MPAVLAFVAPFLHAFADHRDLHSFPTRRSSDLSGTTTATSSSSGRRRSSTIHRPRSTPGASASTGDRKSTRLNSSHLGISYAVFCLKKKTEWSSYGRRPECRGTREFDLGLRAHR